MKRTIYTNPPLEKLMKETRPGKFSQRLGEVVERYDVILKLTGVPEFTDDEILILSKVICGSVVNQTMIRSMHWAVMDAQGDEEIKAALSKKIELLSPAERIMLIESLGQ